MGVGNGLFLQQKSCLCEKYAIKVEFLLGEKIFVVVVIELRVPIFLWDQKKNRKNQGFISLSHLSWSTFHSTLDQRIAPLGRVVT